ncbi:TrmB family transcriptional regulator [Kurthia gibsonii]|uniref:TrmB family transcriptional regulator n=1 Tax=Kurthia gibsonii TaxID=33946 RepID=UPI0011428290|nr:TrmB family transcriptional regulator [Kurthia gibsonii]GED20063.1 transcriptional regulator [Kurthia gibsonii]
MQRIIEILKQRGYTEYESKAYLALIQNGDVTAYQISKDSGIPRARIYDVLNSLIEKGIVSKQEATDKVRYQALPVEVFLQKTATSWQHEFTQLSDTLKELEEKKQQEKPTVLHLQEEEAILSYCRTLIGQAKEKILISVWDDVYELLRPVLEEAAKKVTVHGITLHVENGLPTVDRHRATYFTEKPTASRWFIVSVDSTHMIYGPSLKERPLAFYTDDPIHIRLLEDYIWHDVLVNRLVHRSQDTLEDWVKEQRAAFFLQGY